MKERKDGYFQISLMNVFRQAAEAGDARRRDDVVAPGDDAKVLSTRTLERRAGAGQSTLQRNLANDLSSLMGTIHLEAAEDIEEFEYLRRSVLNYGLQDMTRLTSSDIQNVRLMRDLKAALLRYEPRLIPESVDIRLRNSGEDEYQRLAFDISAEMAAKPADVPLEFVAEIDTGAGKVSMANLSVRG